MSYLRPKSMLLLPKKQDTRVNRSLSSCNNTNNNQGDDNDTREMMKSLICGEMINLPKLSSKTVRVFISSTFSDMVYERNVLMESVYPELKNFCKEYYRLEFQMVDLRWGIREEAHDNHTIIDFCLREIENCRNISIGPSFVIFLGQKYGYRPFPPTINAKEFEAIRDELLISSSLSIHPSPSSSSLPVLTSSSLSPSFMSSSTISLMSSNCDVDLLNEWFKKDTNALNHEYVLQPISSILSDYGNEENPEVKKKSEEEWERYRLKLQEVLRKGVTLCVEHNKLPQYSADKYFVSVTEYEIERGLFDAVNQSDNCLCFMRTIENLENNAHSSRARPYLDFVSPSSETVDKSAQALLNDLQSSKIPNSLTDERNLEYFKVEWTDVDNKDPVDNDVYLKSFCNAFREKMQWLINKSAQNIAKINSTPRMVEILQQFHMCKTRSESLRGREGTLKNIREFITSSFSGSYKLPTIVPKSLNRPLIIFGESGCGKTSVSAKVAYEVRNWFSQCQEPMPIVIFRFLGTTCYSCSIRLVLGSICWQIAMAYNLDTKDIPTDYPGLVFYFHEILKKSSQEMPLVLILDGLDQLGSAHRAHSLAWLPCHLPEHVKLVVSTVPNKFGILTTLQSQMTSIDRQNFIELHPLSPQLSFNLVKEWLRSFQMDLTVEQFSIVQKSLSKCSLPLYARLVFEEVKRWRSYYSEDQTYLEPSIEKIICSLLDRVELSHGHVFVSYTLSYLTASREGLSDVELEDILSLDDHVLNDVFQHWLPPLRRIPPLLVPRLHSELSSYIIQRETNGSMVYYWYHAQFIDVARKRYLSSEPHRNYIHQILAHYFLGTWGGGKLKAYTCNDKQLPWMKSKCREGTEDRKVPLQPLVYGQSDKLLIRSDLAEKPNYNLRKLCELPFHLLESKMYVDLKDQVLFNYEWLYTKISALSLHDVLSDFTLAFQNWKDTGDLALLSSALRMSGSQVNRNPSSLAFDLIGRLLHCYSDHEKHSSIRRLLQQCDQLSLKHSSLIPLQQCFESPSSMVLFVLEGHNQIVSDFIIHEDTNELISVSKDGYLAFWDLVSGERSRTIDVSALNPGRLTRLFQSIDEKYLVVDSDSHESPAEVFDTKTGQLLHRCGAREPTQRRAFISGNLFCRQKSIFNLITGKEIKRVHDFVESKSYVTCTTTPNNKFILFDLTSEIKMFDLLTGEIIFIFDKDDFNDVTIMRCTNDSKLCYCGYAVNCNVVVLDIDVNSSTFGKKLLTLRCLDLNPISRITPKDYSYIQEVSDIKMCLNNQNKILIEVCKSRLIAYDFISCDHVVMGKISNIGDPQVMFTKSSFNFDGKLVLASSENNLHIWNSTSGEHLHMIIIHSTVDFPFPWAISKSRNIVATGSTITTAVRVWDLDKTEEKEISNLKVYKNPIDCIACAAESRVVYVKSYFGLGSSSKGYKYFDRFAIDIWNISTGNWKNFLPFNRYGRLLEMKCSSKGNYLALLLSSLSQWYVVVADVQDDKVICAAGHDVDWQCKHFELSPDWTYMASCAILDQDSEVILWNIKKNKKIVSFREAKSPLFTLDGQYLLYIDAGVNIIIYSLKNFAPAKCQLQVFPDRISTIPIKHHSILVTCFKDSCSEVSVWDFHGAGRTKSIMNGVSRNGISDISKNGALAVDDLLQVFSLTSGNLVTSFRNNVSNFSEENQYKKLVRLTYDGLYCLWNDEGSCSVKVGCINDGIIIAQANVHEKLVTFETMDYGYVIFCGREDGHIITMKLVVPNNENDKLHNKGQPVYLARSEADRRNYILDQDSCSRSTINQFDTNFREMSTHYKDVDIISKCPNIARQLSEHAELPRLFTFLKPSTSKTSASNSCLLVPNSPSVLLFAQQNDFLSTNSLSSSDGRRSRRFHENSNSSGSHNPNSLPRRNNCAKTEIRLVCSSSASLASSSISDSESTSPILDKVEITNNRRSRSAQELFKLNKNLSKSSLDSLISENNSENKCRNQDGDKSKNILGRHSLKLKDEKEKKTKKKLFQLWKFNKSNK